jgi:hypothetical protein
MKSRHRRLMKLVLVTSLAAASISVSAGMASADQSTLRAKAQAELAAVTVDVDTANIMFSPADNGVGANFAKVVQYQQEYLAGGRVSTMVDTPRPSSI